MKLSALLASLFLLAAPASAQTAYTGPFSDTVTVTTTTTQTGTANCTSPNSTTMDCTLSKPLPQQAAITIGPLVSGSAQGGGAAAPVVTSLTCNVLYPIVTGTNVTQTGSGGACGYSATCGGVACAGGNAITSWAITAQSCASCYTITSTGILQGGANAANATSGSVDTVTVTATNSTGTSPGVTQTINVGFVPAWQSVKICCGGQLNGVRITRSDNTIVTAENTYGSYIRRATGTCNSAATGGWGTGYSAPCHEQLVTASSITPSTALVNAQHMGALETVVCESNTNDAYMATNLAVYVSTNFQSPSRTWDKLPTIVMPNANQGTGAGFGHYLACDPNNPNILYVGAPAATYKTTNGLSGHTATVATVSGVGTTGSIPSVIEYDPATTVSGGVSQHFWIFTYSTGVYETANGGASFVPTTSGPTTFTRMKADKFHQLWVVNGTTTVYKYLSGTWTTSNSTGNGNCCIAIDPNSASIGANHVIVSYADGNANISNNNGGTWTGDAFALTFSAPAGQPPWLGVANQSGGSVNFLAVQDIEFDNSSNLWGAGGIGLWESVAPVASNPTVWVSDNVGIEQLVAISAVTAPGSNPCIAVWDRGYFCGNNPDVFPSIYYNNSTTKNIIMGGWGLDYAAPTVGFFTGYEVSNIAPSYSPASSSDGGNSWTGWTQPASSTDGGVIAASSATNWLLVPGIAEVLNYTTTAGGAWTASTISGNRGNFINNTGLRFPIAADRVAANTFCAVDQSTGSGSDQHFFKSINSGATFSLVAGPSAVDGVTFSDMLFAVPGESGHFFYSANGNGGPTHLWKSTNTCTTWTDPNSSLTNLTAFGFGAPKPGGSGYPAIYAYGYLGGVNGMYASFDAAVTWAAISAPSQAQTWPNNSLDYIEYVTGDPNVYGRIIAGFEGSGFTYIDVTDACPAVNFSNAKPTASLTGTVTLQAQSSGRVPVTNVNFYVDGTLIGTQTTGSTSGTPPVTTYSQSWVTGGVATGAHTLRVATTGNGCTASSSSVGNSFSIPITTH